MEVREFDTAITEFPRPKPEFCNLYFNMRILLFIIFITLFSTCIDPFDPGIDGEGRKLVVDGLITNLPDAYTVRLTYSEPYNNDSLTLAVTRATVYITDDLNQRFDLSYTSQGNYVSDTAQFQGEVGRIYTLHIQTPDGKTYQSQPETMLPAPKIDTMYSRFVEKTDSRNVTTYTFDAFVRTQDPSETKNFYQWRWTHYNQLEFCAEGWDSQARIFRQFYCCSSCWAIKRCLGNSCIRVESDLYFNGNRFDFNVAEIPFDSKTDYFLAVDQLALSEGAYRFWKTVNEQLNNTGGIFDVPPAAAVGNLFNPKDPDEQVLGIFSVAGGVRKSGYVRRDYVSQQPLTKKTPEPKVPQRDCQQCIESTARTSKQPEGW